MARHLFFKEHNAVVTTLVRQHNDVGCLPAKQNKQITSINFIENYLQLDWSTGSLCLSGQASLNCRRMQEVPVIMMV